ncbi:hypothetical protein GQ457_13G002990 [Hibiscus cannabinus]
MSGKVLRLCNVNRSVLGREDELQWVVDRLKGKSLIVYILKLAWNGYVYSIWCERNSRIFRGDFRSVIDIVNSINDFVCVKLLKKNVDRVDPINRRLCLAWGVM